MTLDALAPPEGTTTSGGRWNPTPRRLLILGLALVILASLVTVGWVSRHPGAFREGGGWGVGHERWPASTAMYVGFSYEHKHARGAVTIHSVEANVVADSSNATVDFFVCTIDPAADVGAIGSANERSIRQQCSALVPAEGATMQLNAEPRQQLVIAVSPSHAGQVEIHGADVTHSHGWRRGTEFIGGEIQLRSRG